MSLLSLTAWGAAWFLAFAIVARKAAGKPVEDRAYKIPYGDVPSIPIFTVPGLATPFASRRSAGGLVISGDVPGALVDSSFHASGDKL